MFYFYTYTVIFSNVDFRFLFCAQEAKKKERCSDKNILFYPQQQRRKFYTASEECENQSCCKWELRCTETGKVWNVEH